MIYIDMTKINQFPLHHSNLSRNAPVDEDDTSIMTPLMLATKNGHTEVHLNTITHTTI